MRRLRWELASRGGLRMGGRGLDCQVVWGVHGLGIAGQSIGKDGGWLG